RPRNQLKAFIVSSDENDLVFDTSEERKPYSVSTEKCGPSWSRWYFNLLGWKISSLHLVGPPRRSPGDSGTLLCRKQYLASSQISRFFFFSGASW
ncbi:hypothetical protein FCV25MIE_17053, partial [Fagus crenata]